jgi:hypothetical protein
MLATQVDNANVVLVDVRVNFVAACGLEHGLRSFDSLNIQGFETRAHLLCH